VHTHVVYREVNDSCRQFVHKHVPVTLLERAIRRGADDAGRSLRARTCSRPCSLVDFPRVWLPLVAATLPARNGRRKPHVVQRDIRISFIHTNFGTNLDLRELSATRQQNTGTILEPEQRYV